ncbi:MAG: hypothetical protein HUU48_00125 [Flavobacteriales bacterium]|nr:hypothetical protein [Flavobacteriales bacterium]
MNCTPSENNPIKPKFRSPSATHAERISVKYVMMVFVFFGGFISIAYVGHYTLISVFFISKVIAFFLVVFMLFPFRWYKRFLSFNIYEILLFNVLTVGPGMTALLLWINFLICTEIKTEVYFIRSKQLETVGTFNANKHTIILENNAYEEYPEIRIFENSNYPLLAKATAIRYKMGNGILGYKVVLEYEFLE